jgi:pyruvate, water dikinase
VAHLFDERNSAVRRMIAHVIATARHMGKPIGICGQAPSDYPDFAAWLVHQRIDSISLNPDTAIKTALLIAKTEAEDSRQRQHEVPEPGIWAE